VRSKKQSMTRAQQRSSKWRADGLDANFLPRRRY
jgi:hypothetical protein